MAGSWTRCKANQVIRLDFIVDLVSPYLGSKGSVASSCNIVAMHCG